MKFLFQKFAMLPHDPTSIEFRVEVDELDHLVSEIESFLRACGYNPPGSLDFVLPEVGPPFGRGDR